MFSSHKCRSPFVRVFGMGAKAESAYLRRVSAQARATTMTLREATEHCDYQQHPAAQGRDCPK
jgi:hypothetical protein